MLCDHEARYFKKFFEAGPIGSVRFKEVTKHREALISQPVDTVCVTIVTTVHKAKGDRFLVDPDVGKTGRNEISNRKLLFWHAL